MTCKAIVRTHAYLCSRNAELRFEANEVFRNSYLSDDKLSTTSVIGAHETRHRDVWHAEKLLKLGPHAL